MYYTTLALLISLVLYVGLISANEPETVAYFYEKGVEAYLEERYPQCVEKLEAALKRYRYLTKSTQHCRLKCKHDHENEAPFYPENIDDLQFFEKNLKITLCILRCKARNSDNSEYLGGELEKIFEERKPYEYLNLCYYKINDKQKAASAAFTFLVAHPNHPVMSKNLDQYSQMPEVDMKDIINFEAEDYVYLYAYGADAYEKKDWNSVINHMEESLVSYLQAEDECRAHCEGPFNPGWHPDFIPAIANHFSFVLKCKRKCASLLGTLNGEKYDDLLASHYHYLQYAYFKKGNMPAACQAVSSYLLLIPDDITMLENMKYYAKLPKVLDEYFQPREEAVHYTQRDTYERKILEFIKDEFKLPERPEVKIKGDTASGNDSAQFEIDLHVQPK
ncbi:prolyl 3-hydroxylase 1-like [Anthonomus grandis grandis]|uniref:prolyl 3-hydroxylase 1-like n=1 Tax=Anthonomus grandis grandis TaxID=2921223 RepID=UPI0021653B9E|nr:prolyl 3-hydroxylase 1-like [Anthonomus grandis grandis]